MTTQENKQWLQSALYGYTEARFKDRFKNIYLTEAGLLKVGTCLGFLALNENLIDNFFSTLERLSSTDFVDVDYNDRIRKTPRKIIKLSDDGTLFGFSFIQMIYVQKKTDRSEVFGYWDDHYAFGGNGAIIFHGLGNNNFTVTLDNNVGWQTHT